ncbi:hypothetical protein ABW21_db0205072 [Orbilia brochopaga]|nr:hypothetical protein ABW21_db0205072 [Drechslerella brochopaga]
MSYISADEVMEEELAAVFEAIDEAPPHHLRKVLKYLCINGSADQDHVQNLLAQLSKPTGTSPSTEEARDEMEALLKTQDDKADRQTKCSKCGELFFLGPQSTQSIDSPCHYHTGYRCINSEAEIWEKILPYTKAGRPLPFDYDTFDLYNEDPEAYIWSCCGKNADQGGCERGVHEPPINDEV